MTKKELQIAKKIVNLLINDWMISDDNDDFDYMVLVDSNRKIHQLKPTKEIIAKMQKEGLIYTDDVFNKREFMKLLGKKIAIPFVYDFSITKKGNDLLN